MRRSLMLLPAIIVCMSSIGCGGPPAPGSTVAQPRSRQAIADSLADAGWESIFGNSFSDARTQFSLALKNDRNNLRANQGLIVADVISGNDQSALDHLQMLSRQKPQGVPSEYLLRELCDCLSQLFRSNPGTWTNYLRNLEQADSLSVGEARCILRERLRSSFDKGDTHSVQFLANKLNYIIDWSFLGPFDNAAGCGHGRMVVSAEAPGTEFEGKHQIPIRWSAPSIDYAPISGVLSLGNYFPMADHATGYAISTLATTQATDCLFSISHQGAINVLLNGKRIYSYDRYSNRQEQVHVQTHLRLGNNQLLVEASGLEQRASFSIGVSRLDGKPLPGLVQSGLIRPAPAEADSSNPKQQEIPFLSSCAATYAADPDDPEALLWYLTALSKLADEEDVRPAIRELGDRYEDAALIQMMKALLLNKVEEPAKSRQIMHRMSKTTPACIPLGTAMIQEYMSFGQLAQAERLHATLFELSPQSIDLKLLDMELAALRGRKSEAQSAALKLVRVHPELVSIYSHLLDYYANIGNAQKHAYYRNAWIEQLPAFARWSLRKREAMEQKDYRDAHKYASLLSKLAPDSPFSWASQYYLALLAGNYQSIKAIEQALASFPYSLELLERLAGIRDVTDRPDDARSLQERIIALDPLNFEVRNALRAKKDLPAIEEILPTPAFGDYLPSDSVLAAVETGTPALVLADIDQRIVLGDGANVECRYVLVKVLTDRGVTTFGRQGLDLGNGTTRYGILEARTIKPDGRHIEAERLGASVAFQSLTPGDVVELSYRTISLQPGVLAHEVWDHFSFQWSNPCLYAEYTLLVPEDLPFESILHNAAPEQAEQTVETIEDFEKHTWSMSDLPGYWAEFHAPPSRERVPWLDISTIEDWGVITSWYDQYTTWPTTVTEQVRETADRLVGHLTDPLEITRELFCYVRDEIEYDSILFGHGAYVPRQADDVLVSQYGDCKDQSALLIALLSASGIEADFVLTSTEMANTPFLPSPRFIHAIVAAKVKGQTLYLDPTQEFLPFDPDYRPNEETSALSICPEETLQTWSGEQPSARPDTVRIIGRLDESGVLTAKVLKIQHNRRSVATSRAESALFQKKDRRELYAMTLASAIPGCVLEDVTWEEDEGENKSASCTSTIRLQPLQFSEGGLAVLSIGAVGLSTKDLAVRAALPTRENDLLMNDIARDVVQLIEVALPSSIRAYDIPEDVTVNGSSVSYNRAIEVRNNKLHFARRLAIAGDRVTTENYPAFKAGLDRALQDIGRPVVLKRRP